jgi:predicted 3-demethylubiquinone-9 3-methyltransferase (glyoxalase superfamily)
MPITETPVSEKFCWVDDIFGVSWQLNLPKNR